MGEGLNDNPQKSQHYYEEHKDKRDVFLPPHEQVEYEALTRAQTEGGSAWTEKKKTRFLELQEKEAASRKAHLEKESGGVH